MRIKPQFLIIIIIMMLVGCSAPSYVPEPSLVNINTRGAYISIDLTVRGVRNVKGELIAVSEEYIYVLRSKEGNKQVDSVNVKLVRDYDCRFAQPKGFGWTIPVFTLATISHGWFAFITMPINFISAVIINNGPDYDYSQRKLPIDLLNRYARFPQGLPPGIDLKELE